MFTPQNIRFAGAPKIYPTKFPAEIIAGTPKIYPTKFLTEIRRGPEEYPT